MRLVFDALQGGTPRSQLMDVTRLTSRRDVSTVIQNLRREGFLARPSAEDTALALEESGSLARDGLRVAIRPYALMGMTSFEIQQALINEGRNVFSLTQINGSLEKARRKYPERTIEEKRDASKNCITPPETIQQRVGYWLAARNMLLQGSERPELPHGRMEWILVAEFARAKEEMLTGRGERLQVVQERISSLSPEAATRVLICIDIIYQQYPDELIAVLTQKGRKIPDEPRDRLFLLEYFIARNYEKETGDHSLLRSLCDRYDQDDPEIFSRLQEGVTVIRDHTKVSNDKKLMPIGAMIQYGDVGK